MLYYDHVVVTNGYLKNRRVNLDGIKGKQYANYQFSAAAFLFLGRSQMSESPEEVEAEEGHPAEHGEAGEVERVADGEASLERDRDEELGRLRLDLAVRGDRDVVGDHQKEGRQEDEEYVGADNFALKLIQFVIKLPVTCQALVEIN